MKNLGLVQLMELKRQKEQTLWTLGFRLAPRELFDTIVEIEKEIELRVQQIATLIDSKECLSFVEIGMETLVRDFEDLLDLVKLQEYIRD